MNYQKIGRICKAAKQLMIYERDGTQYIGDGCALYSLSGMPKMTPGQLAAMLGLDLSEMSANVTENVNANLSDSSCEDIVIEHEGISCELCGTDVLALYTHRGAVCIAKKYLTPFKKSEVGEINLYLRGSSVVVKQGLYFMATILPFSLKGTTAPERYAELVRQLEIARTIEEREAADEEHIADEQ